MDNSHLILVLRTFSKKELRELQKWLDEGRSVRLLDTRNIYEYELGTFDGAEQLHIDHFREFPEDIKLAGASFNTTIGGTAIQAEYSYHWDQPFQVDDVELLFAALSPIDPFLGLPFPAGLEA